LVRRDAARVQGAAEPGSILITATVDCVAWLAMTGRSNLP
jgi:class 3 adenylate cyclase